MSPVSGVDNFIPVAKPCLDQHEVQAAGRAILSGWVTQGPEVAAFEREFAEYAGGKFACAVSNCTTALHLALRAVGVQPGDEVITVSHSFIATANSVRYCGAKPIFVDIEPGTFNIDPSLIEPAITERTRAILCVHQMGMPCDISAVVGIAGRRSLAVVEDAACAVGSEVLCDGKWDRIGRPHGDIACFSFHPRKLLTTGDGGMLTTNSEQLDRKFRLWRQHSMSVTDTARHNAQTVVFESYPELGFNYRMTDIQAAVGREQLKRMPEIVKRRRQLVALYRELLANVQEVVLPVEPAWAKSNWQSFCIRLPDTVDQRQVMQTMLDLGVATRRGIMCAHREQAYKNEAWSCNPPSGSCRCLPFQCERLSVSEQAQERSIVLPLYHEMSESDLTRVVDSLKTACCRSR